MKNANERHESAAQMGDVAYNVMYDSPFGLVHRKVVKGGLQKTFEKQHQWAVLMEEAYPSEEGMCAVYAILPNQLKAVAKGPATTPRKPKNRPKKGTKPWTKIPYKFEDVEVGDIVTYYSDSVKYSHRVNEKDANWWSAEDGAGTGPLWPGREAHILKPYKEPLKPQEGEVYRIGDRFEISGKYKVMLCRVKAYEAQLIVYEGSEMGNRWSDRHIEVRRDSTVSVKALLEFVSLSSESIKKI